MKRLWKSRTCSGRTLLSLAICASLCSVPAGTAVAKKPGMQVIVVDDLGSYAGILVKMEAYEWEVTTMSSLEVLKRGAVVLRDYDVVWIPAKANYPALRRLAEKKSPLDAFVKGGGVVVLMGINPDGFWIDATLRGADAKPLPAGGAGTVSIVAPEHPMISGIGTRGVPLVDSDLDPSATGGRGNIVNLPRDSSVTVIASNEAGCVVVDLTHGDGHVFLSTLLQEEDVCKANVLLFIESISE